MPSHVYEPIANHALAVYPRLNAPGFESSKVFALTALYLASPPPGFPSQRALGKHLASLYLFILHPTKRRKSEYVPEAPEVFFIHVTKDKTEVGRGTASKFSKRLLQGRTRNVVVLECSTYLIPLTYSRQGSREHCHGQVTRGPYDRRQKGAS